MPEHDHPDLEDNLEELAAAVLGPQRSEFAGGGRYEDEGLVHKVDLLLERTERQTIKLPWQLWTAIIGALGALAVQLVATFGQR